MRLGEIGRDARGTTAVEFGLTGPIFIMLIVGIIEGGLLLWTQVGLQHGVEVAARRSSVNGASVTPPVCDTTSAIKTYAAQQSFGLNPAASNFTVSTPVCGCQVSASYSFPFTAYFKPAIDPQRSSLFPDIPAIACRPIRLRPDLRLPPHWSARSGPPVHSDGHRLLAHAGNPAAAAIVTAGRHRIRGIA